MSLLSTQDGMLRVVEALSRALSDPPPDADEPAPTEGASLATSDGSTPSDTSSPAREAKTWALGLALPCAHAGGGLCCSSDAQSAHARLAAFESRFGAGGARGIYPAATEGG